MQVDAIFSVCISVMFIAGFVALVGGLIWWQRSRTNKTAALWAELATDLGLHYDRPNSWNPGVISGPYKNFQVQIWVFTRGGGKNKTTLTAVKTYVNPQLQLGLKVYREHMMSGIGKVLGFQDIQTGDKEFDDRFVVKGRDEPGILRLLNANTRQEILRYDRFAPRASVDDEGAYWEKVSIISDTTLLTHTLDAQSQVVRAMSQAALDQSAGEF